ncbi:MAG TPA: serine/threonine-protein kinase [Solirubrobacteraceae bacterium]|nr:serine/threonine-protein kinase [Solirubrobacteraceae bacterium]
MDSPQTLLQTPGRTREGAGESPHRTPIAARPPVRAAERGPDRGASGERLLLDRYRLLSRLGAGGFGVVWRAHDELLHREVAVKRIWLGPDGDAERASREAQATARLSHPAIVALYEACPLGEAFYLISELVPGRTLGALIRAGELEDEQTLRVGLDLIDALEHAHERGVIHRDIKPQNVLVPEAGAGREGTRRPPTDAAAKLTDFGGASIAEEDALTRTGDVLGTLAYMAPEQSEGREVGEEADLYSLALVLYEALSGVNPVRGPSPAATARRIGTRLEPLRRRRRDLPNRLTGAIDAALEPSPRDRGGLEDLRVALADALEDLGGDTLPEPVRERDGIGRRSPRRPRLALSPATAAAALADPQAARDVPPAPAGPELEPAGLPRKLSLALSLAAIVWLCATGRAGIGVLLAAALAPLAVLPAERATRRLPAAWLGALLAPVLGLAGLAGAFPALAGQARRPRERLLLGALGYWWLVLAEPLLARRLWLGAPAGAPVRAGWEGSIGAGWTHVVGPLLSTGTALGMLLWGLAAVVLPWLVRGTSAAVDVFAVVVWSALLVACAPALDAGLRAGSHPLPRGAVLAAVLGGLIAVGARALRGPAGGRVDRRVGGHT